MPFLLRCESSNVELSYNDDNGTVHIDKYCGKKFPFDYIILSSSANLSIYSHGNYYLNVEAIVDGVDITRYEIFENKVNIHDIDYFRIFGLSVKLAPGFSDIIDTSSHVKTSKIILKGTRRDCLEYYLKCDTKHTPNIKFYEGPYIYIPKIEQLPTHMCTNTTESDIRGRSRGHILSAIDYRSFTETENVRLNFATYSSGRVNWDQVIEITDKNKQVAFESSQYCKRKQTSGFSMCLILFNGQISRNMRFSNIQVKMSPNTPNDYQCDFNNVEMFEKNVHRFTICKETLQFAIRELASSVDWKIEVAIISYVTDISISFVVKMDDCRQVLGNGYWIAMNQMRGRFDERCTSLQSTAISWLTDKPYYQYLQLHTQLNQL